MPILALRVFSAWRARFLADLIFATAVTVSCPQRICFVSDTLCFGSVTSGARQRVEAREQVERELIETTLEAKAGNVAGAARDLGVSRVTLYRLMENFGLKSG